MEGRLHDEHEELLASCYRSCLDLAARLSGVRTVAFCAISTGVFGFPKVPAARVALRTVAEWLGQHPKALDLLVFNVFSDSDARRMRNALRIGKVWSAMTQSDGDAAKITSIASQVRQWLQSCEHVLIGAGAGLSASAGIDYTDPVSFARLFPALVRREVPSQIRAYRV